MTEHFDPIQRMEDLGYYARNGHFKLSSGNHSDVYVQVRLALMHQDFLEEIGQIAVKQLRSYVVDGIASFTVGGLLLAQYVSQKLNVDLIVGKNVSNQVEWVGKPFDRDYQNIVLIDDIFTNATQAKLALRSIEKYTNSNVAGILVAMKRTDAFPDLEFRDHSAFLLSCISRNEAIYAPSDCPLCKMHLPIKDLSNPETDPISVIISQPKNAALIARGYREVFELQEEFDAIEQLAAWEPWLPMISSGLPTSRLEEDNRLIRFISHIAKSSENRDISLSVMSELIGQLINLSSVRVENRSLGCSILIGNEVFIKRRLEMSARVVLPYAATTGEISTSELGKLIPLFDALLEDQFVFVADQAGNFKDVRRLVDTRTKTSHVDGIPVLRTVTIQAGCIGFVLHRGRGSISVYENGRLEAVGERSEKTGLWEFSRPFENLDEIIHEVPAIEGILGQVVEISREMVARGFGGLFVLGDHTGLQHAEPKIEIEPQLLSELAPSEIVEYAKLDGAVLISMTGVVEKVSVIIRNQTDAKEKSKTRHHGGARKEAARRTSIECPNAAAIYVSQNGGIEIFVNGNSWPISETMSGFSRTKPS